MTMETSSVVLTGGLALPDGTVLVRANTKAAVDVRTSPSVIVPWRTDGPGRPTLLPKGITGQCNDPTNEVGTLALGFDGSVFSIVSSGVSQTSCFSRPDDQPPNQWMHSLRAIGSDVYAVGMNYSVRVRRSDGQWTDMADRIDEYLGLDELGGFLDVGGIDSRQIVAVGTSGLIAVFDGGTWVRVPSPTSVTLSSIVVLPSGECAIGGQRGVLLVGRPDSLRVIELPTPEEDVMSCEYFDEKIFVATRKRVFYLRENDLVACALKQGSGRPSAGFLTAAGGVLWSIGASAIFVLQQDVWIEVPSPFQKEK